MDLAGEINQRMRGQLPEYLGITVESASTEEVVGGLVVEAKLCTAQGILHGGSIMALADTLGAVTAFLNLPAGARTATVESKTNFLHTAPIGTKVTGRTRLVHKGRTLILVSTELRDDTGKLLAITSQSQIIMRDT